MDSTTGVTILITTFICYSSVSHTILLFHIYHPIYIVDSGLRLSFSSETTWCRLEYVNGLCGYFTVVHRVRPPTIGAFGDLRARRIGKVEDECHPKQTVKLTMDPLLTCSQRLTRRKGVRPLEPKIRPTLYRHSADGTMR